MGKWWLAASSEQCACSFYSSCAGCFFGKTLHHPGPSVLLQPRFGSLRLLTFPKAKIAVGRDICACDGHTVHKRLTADWLAPWKSDCSRILSSLLWLAAKLHQGQTTHSQDIQNGSILSRQTLYRGNRNACITMNISNILYVLTWVGFACNVQSLKVCQSHLQ